PLGRALARGGGLLDRAGAPRRRRRAAAPARRRRSRRARSAGAARPLRLWPRSDRRLRQADRIRRDRFPAPFPAAARRRRGGFLDDRDAPRAARRPAAGRDGKEGEERAMMIRDAQTGDLEQILAIFNEVIANSTAVYATAPTSLAERTEWFEQRRRRGYPVLVAAE